MELVPAEAGFSEPAPAAAAQACHPIHVSIIAVSRHHLRSLVVRCLLNGEEIRQVVRQSAFIVFFNSICAVEMNCSALLFVNVDRREPLVGEM